MNIISSFPSFVCYVVLYIKILHVLNSFNLKVFNLNSPPQLQFLTNHLYPLQLLKTVHYKVVKPIHYRSHRCSYNKRKKTKVWQDLLNYYETEAKVDNLMRCGVPITSLNQVTIHQLTICKFLIKGMFKMQPN